MNKINVYSEIGKLKKVLLHQPGQELERITPENLKKFLFDDIAFYEQAAKEHAYFQQVLKNEGVEIVYLEELLQATLRYKPQLKATFIATFISKAKIDPQYQNQFRQFLSAKDEKQLIRQLIIGTTTTELGINGAKFAFISNPLPNLLFQRDPFASVGNGAIINKMWANIRSLETFFIAFIFEHHPEYQNKIPCFYDSNEKFYVEGGDIFVLNKETLIIGCSQRTEMAAINKIAATIFKQNDNSFTKVVVLTLPKTRAFMHLDTVFTQVDHDKFLVHPLIFDYSNQFQIHEITKTGTTLINKDLPSYLSYLINKPVMLIKCGGDDPIAQAREQWNDGANVLAIAPGKVIAYERNYVTINLLKAAGITVISIPSSELSRGRGGPRCMSMPLFRENI